MQYRISPQCLDNCKNALIRIGEINPLNVKARALDYSTNSSIKSQLLKIGIMNVRKRLNTNLGQNGKYSMRMIRSLANTKVKYYENEDPYICTKIPDREYVAIITAIFSLLDKIDKQFCDALLHCESISEYIGKNQFNGRKYKVTAPVQTGMVKGAQGKGSENIERLNILKRSIK